VKQPPQFHQIIFDSLHEGLYSVDKNFKIIGFNKAAERITGYKREEVLGKFCKNILKADRCKIGCPIAYSLEMNENVTNYSMVITDKNDNGIPIKVNAAIFRDEKGEEVGGVVLFRSMQDMEVIRRESMRKREYQGIIGGNKKMQEIYTLIEEISESDASVMIQGGSGTGKELIANAIQQTSQRRDKPYLRVNCSVFPHNLLASELFGHVKGAYTDAHKDRVGRFEMAHGGTIFLDEIAEADPRIQIQLLRVLQEGTFERVGESVTRNLDIQKAIADGKFRDDLYYRLNVIPIHLPPLAERRDDLPLLIDHFLKKYSLLTGRKVSDIDDEAMEILMNHSWPGNIRELENVVEYAIARTKDSVITAVKLPPFLRHREAALISTRPESERGRNETEVERIKNALDEARWNRTETARILGIGRATLWRKMKLYGLI
jgi:PAS domain S-box-containing protein